MRFSIFSVADHYPEEPRTIRDLYTQLLDEIELADELGFSAFFLAEHHFHEYGLVPSPPTLLGSAAGRTKQIGLGVAVSVLPFHHPLVAAEEYAMLDQLSGGRLVLGVGSGYLKHEFEGFYIGPWEKRARFDEALKILVQAWEGKPFSYHGLYHHVENARIAVMDLGGGSTELVTARNMHITWRTSLPIGSGWLHDRYLPGDPPTPDDLSVARTFLRTYLQGIRIKPQPPKLIVTGGSANSLLLVARQAFRLDPSSNRLTYDDLLRCEGLMSAFPAEEISLRYRQPIGRARILPAGALIMREVMSRLNLHEISISPHGLREGVLLAYARYGEGWLERVNEESSPTTSAVG